MILFFHLVKLSFKQQLAYRLALWSGLATNLFFGLLRAALMIALYGTLVEVNGLSVGGAVTFVGVTQAMIAYLTIFGSTEIMDTIYSGAIGADLLRPVSFFVFWMGRDFGKALVNLVGRGVFFMLAYSLFFPVILPKSLDQWLALGVSLLFAWMVSFCWRFLVNLSAFWTPDAWGVIRIAFTLSQFLSGFIMPLRLLPDWFNALIQYTPFPAMLNTSVEVYMGTMPLAKAWEAIWLQGVWFLALAGLAHLVLRAGVRRLVIQGG